MAADASPPESTLQLPRILCLHGGGVTAEIFSLQARVYINQLQTHFRLVFADGPFFCQPGPGMIPVFASMGPFRRWLRWLPEHPEIDDQSALEELEYALSTCMAEDDARGATGEWVGLMGFSQGAKLSFSMLLDQQLRLDAQLKASGQQTNGQKQGNQDGMYGGFDEEDQESEVPKDLPVGFAGGKWRFGIILAGRAPPAALSEYGNDNQCLVKPGSVSEGFNFDAAGENPQKLRFPTLHVHGRQDAGLHLHKRLVDMYTVPGSAKVIEWDGEHRVQIKRDEVAISVKGILETAKRAGVKVPNSS